jgi:hypothetical protein
MRRPFAESQSSLSSLAEKDDRLLFEFAAQNVMPKHEFTCGSVHGKIDGTGRLPELADKEGGAANRHEVRQTKHGFW